MNKKNIFMLRGFIIMMVLAVIVYTGCCTHSAKPIPIVVIRETQLRSDKMILPLNAGSKTKLDEYLKKGGDWQNPYTVSFYKKDFYDRILGLLDDDDRKIEMTDLFIKRPNEVWVLMGSAAKCFIERPIYGVFDSCLNRPDMKANRPFSLFDGNLWWVFYRDENDLNWIRFVQVTVPVEGAIPPSWKWKKD